MDTNDVLEYRRKEREKATNIEVFINSIYPQLCEVLAMSEGRAFTVDTPFGQVQFLTKGYFSYKRLD